jgi:hypothetical protein
MFIIGFNLKLMFIVKGIITNLLTNKIYNFKSINVQYFIMRKIYFIFLLSKIAITIGRE